MHPHPVHTPTLNQYTHVQSIHHHPLYTCTPLYTTTSSLFTNTQYTHILSVHQHPLYTCTSFHTHTHTSGPYTNTHIQSIYPHPLYTHTFSLYTHIQSIHKHPLYTPTFSLHINTHSVHPHPVYAPSSTLYMYTPLYTHIQFNSVQNTLLSDAIITISLYTTNIHTRAPTRTPTILTFSSGRGSCGSTIC